MAADLNLPAEARALIAEYGAEIAWYPEDSYFRPGGIWKKITDQWQAIESDYVAYFHYDDLWEDTKLAEQVAFIEAHGLDGCYTRGYRIDDDGQLLSGDLALLALDRGQAGSHPGAWVTHSLLLRRDAILGSGLLEHEQRWAAIFEQLFFLYVLKLGNVRKCATTAFYWRDHPHNLSNTARDEEVEFVREQRERTRYTHEETLADADAIDLAALAERVRAGRL